ncbi:hypothetical protein SDJN02_22575, partial [Cucurbita argyrosperma subsp. argyrosperma]
MWQNEMTQMGIASQMQYTFLSFKFQRQIGSKISSFSSIKWYPNRQEVLTKRPEMGSMKIVAVALIAILLVATLSSAAYAIDDDSMDLVFDGRDINHGVPRKIMKWGVLNHEERVCPKILMECKKDSDCLAECICLEHGYCG